MLYMLSGTCFYAHDYVILCRIQTKARDRQPALLPSWLSGFTTLTQTQSLGRKHLLTKGINIIFLCLCFKYGCLVKNLICDIYFLILTCQQEFFRRGYFERLWLYAIENMYSLISPEKVRKIALR